MLTPKICSADAEGHKGLNTEMKSWRLLQHAQRGPDPCIGQCRLSYNVCHLLQVVERTEGDGRENDLGGVLKQRQGAAQASEEQEDADADPDCTQESCRTTTSAVEASYRECTVCCRRLKRLRGKKVKMTLVVCSRGGSTMRMHTSHTKTLMQGLSPHRSCWMHTLAQMTSSLGKRIDS